MIELHLNVFNASQLSELWELIGDNIEWAASVLGIVAFIGWIATLRPRAHRISQTSFIDYESDHIIEEIQLRISWGHVFFLRKIKLPRIERNATFKILCKSLGGIKDILHMDNYNESSSGLSTNIFLVNKKFFKNEEIEEIFLEITRPAPPDYHDKIKTNQTSKRIEVLNWNHIEVKEFPVELPKTITLDKILAYSAFFSQWKTPSDPENGIIVFLESIPPCKGEKPGKAIIQLS